MSDPARIYVGTYHKYNSGSIKGAWLDLESYGDTESFVEACKELHKDESDPELMFQDFQGFPRSFYSESPDTGKLDALFAWLELDDEDRELLAVYQDNVVDSDADIEQAREAFLGKFNRPEDWAADWLEQTGELEQIPERLRYYFDYEAYARDARIGGDVSFVEHDGETWVFSNNV